MENNWKFTQLENETKVDFFIKFEFKSKLLEMIIGSLFNIACQKMVKAFMKPRMSFMAKLVLLWARNLIGKRCRKRRRFWMSWGWLMRVKLSQHIGRRSGMMEFAEGAEAAGVQVIIAGAGGAAHLPGMVASLTILPVLGRAS